MTSWVQILLAMIVGCAIYDVIKWAYKCKPKFKKKPAGYIQIEDNGRLTEHVFDYGNHREVVRRYKSMGEWHKEHKA